MYVYIQFKVDRLQIIVLAKHITVLQLFISRCAMCAIPQLVSAPLNPISKIYLFQKMLSGRKTKVNCQTATNFITFQILAFQSNYNIR